MYIVIRFRVSQRFALSEVKNWQIFSTFLAISFAKEERSVKKPPKIYSPQIVQYSLKITGMSHLKALNLHIQSGLRFMYYYYYSRIFEKLQLNIMSLLNGNSASQYAVKADIDIYVLTKLPA